MMRPYKLRMAHARITLWLDFWKVLEKSLAVHKHHAGLCHMYVHLSEMSADPGKALVACRPLRKEFPHAGHLIHMVSFGCR